MDAPALTHMDLLMIGIESFKFRQWEFLSLTPTYTLNQNETFSLNNGFTSQQNSFNMSYFAISRAKDNYCSNCRDGNIVY